MIENGSLSYRFFKLGNTPHMRAELYGQISGYMKAGLAIDRAVWACHETNSEERTDYKSTEALALRDWYEQMRHGKKFSQSLDGWASDSEKILFGTAESTHKLDEALNYTKKISQMRGRITKEVLQPLKQVVFIYLMALVIGLLIIYLIYPIYLNIFPVENWTGGSLILKWGRDLTLYALIPSYPLVVIYILVNFSLVNKLTGKSRRLFENSFVFEYFRLINVSTFLYTLASCSRAGLSPDEYIRIAKETGSPWWRDRLGRLYSNITTKNLIASLKGMDVPFLDRKLALQLTAFEDSGDLAEALDNAVDKWVDNFVARFKLKTTMINVYAQSIFITIATVSTLGPVYVTIQYSFYI